MCQLLQIPFDTSSPDIITHLYEPISPNRQIHCVLESTTNGYTLQLEHLNQYIPLLQAKKKSRKRGSVQCAYSIEPAFDCSQIAQSTDGEEGHWAESLSASSVVATNSTDIHSNRSRPQSTSFLKQLWAALNPVHHHGVMDIAQGEPVCSAAASTDEACIEKTVLAELEGNSVTNRFRFHTTSTLFKDGHLGSVNICTNYIKCKPRKLTISLPAAGGVSDDTVLHSKEPEWNDEFQIYELDFGGRVSRDSIKNFQIEKDGQVVRCYSYNDA